MMRLNIPDINESKETKFDSVSFVNQMTNHSLKVLVKRMWENFQMLATQLEDNRNDVTNAIDQILSGQKWSGKDIKARNSYMIHNGEIIQFDSGTNQFSVLRFSEGQLDTIKVIEASSQEDLHNFVNPKKVSRR